MINANELRVGNWYLSFGVDYKQVEQLTKGKILVDFHPIPLTEEILVKCGFVRTGLLYELGDCHFGLKIHNDKFLLANPTYQMVYELGNLVYLHQLQNLFYALTGEELNVEL